MAAVRCCCPGLRGWEGKQASKQPSQGKANTHLAIVVERVLPGLEEAALLHVVEGEAHAALGGLAGKDAMAEIHGLARSKAALHQRQLVGATVYVLVARARGGTC